MMSTNESILKSQGIVSMHRSNSSLPGRVLSVVFATLAISGLVYLVLIGNRGIQPPVLRWALVCGLGCASGFAARLLLPRRAILLQWLSAVLALLSGLVFLGLFSRGEIGIQLSLSSQDTTSLAWFSQLILASGAALLALVSWKKPSNPPHKKNSPTSPGIPYREPRSKKIKSAAATRRIPNRHPRKSPGSTKTKELPSFAQREYWEKHWVGLRRSLRSWWENGISEPVPQSPSLRRRKRTAIRMGARLPRRNPRPQPETATNIHLIGKEEHRCPYCLEEVQPKDPRGVNICPICQTHHHADCWAVTGTCQVPHYHE